MIWPNEFAAWLIDMLGITSDNIVGVVTLASIFVYFVFVVVVPASVGAWIVSCKDNRL